MEDLKAKLEALAIQHGKAFASDALVMCAFPALEAAVKASASPIDDIVLAALEEPMKAALLDMLAKVGV